MILPAPRVAFFTDSFHEVNGVALTSRQLEAFAHRRSYPFFSVHTGPATKVWQDASITRCELQLSAASFKLETDLRFDLAFLRHRRLVEGALHRFQPDLVHITGPSHLGILGAIAARELRVPLVASWHTNIHEFGGRRVEAMLRFLPERARRAIGANVEAGSLMATAWFYRMAGTLLAPNPELIAMLERRTRRKCFLMRRGVDTSQFHPSKRQRPDASLVVGYIGRVSPEKNVQELAAVERALVAASVTDYRIFVAGHGGLLEWLRENLVRHEIPGILKGDDLARAYADLDIFVFPSETDTFGNVAQEAMASGVPCVVTDKGGPAFIVHHGVDGFVAPTGTKFADAVVRLALDPQLRHTMATAARATAERASWDSVFEDVYAAYDFALGRAVPLESK